jgi:hypothetical protein
MAATDWLGQQLDQGLLRQAAMRPLGTLGESLVDIVR